MSIVSIIFILLVAYQLKHFLADFPLQVHFMLGKFLGGWKWVAPLLAHVAVHGMFTLFIASMFFWCIGRPEPNYLRFKLALIDMVIHFTMDRIKAGPKWFGQFKPLTGPEYMKAHDVVSYGNPIEISWHQARTKLRHNWIFWNTIGFDQLVHHLTHYYIIYRLVSVSM